MGKVLKCTIGGDEMCSRALFSTDRPHDDNLIAAIFNHAVYEWCNYARHHDARGSNSSDRLYDHARRTALASPKLAKVWVAYCKSPPAPPNPLPQGMPPMSPPQAAAIPNVLIQ